MIQNRFPVFFNTFCYGNVTGQVAIQSLKNTLGTVKKNQQNDCKNKNYRLISFLCGKRTQRDPAGNGPPVTNVRTPQRYAARVSTAFRQLTLCIFFLFAFSIVPSASVRIIFPFFKRMNHHRTRQNEKEKRKSLWNIPDRSRRTFVADINQTSWRPTDTIDWVYPLVFLF